MTLNSVMAVILRNFTENETFGPGANYVTMVGVIYKPVCNKNVAQRTYFSAVCNLW